MSTDTSAMEDGDSLLAAEGCHLSVDLCTPSQTVRPLAASTVLRDNNCRPRVEQQYLDESGRSSLGILPMGTLQDLSTSMLHWSLTSPTKQLQQSNRGLTCIPESNPVPCMEASYENISSRNDAQSTVETNQVSSVATTVTPSTVVSNCKADTDRMSRTRLFAPSIDSGNMSGQESVKRNSRGEQHQGRVQGLDLMAGGMLFGGRDGDADASVVEVELNEEELRQFDEDFSDMDTTVTEGSPREEHSFPRYFPDNSTHPGTPFPSAPTVPSLRGDLLSSMYFRGGPGYNVTQDSRLTDAVTDVSLFTPRDDLDPGAGQDLSLFTSQRSSLEGFRTIDNSRNLPRLSGPKLDPTYIQQHNLTSKSEGPNIDIPDRSLDCGAVNQDQSLFPASEQSFGTRPNDSLFSDTTLGESFISGQTPRSSSLFGPSELEAGVAIESSTRPYGSKQSIPGAPWAQDPVAFASQQHSRISFGAHSTSLLSSRDTLDFDRNSTGQNLFSPLLVGADSGGSAFVPYTENRESYRVVSSQQKGDKPPPVNRNVSLLHSANSSEIDTDDEIAAVRQENALLEEGRRQRGVGSGDVDAHGSRPGLDGGSSEENDGPKRSPPQRRSIEHRQSAEGDVMTSPLLGDGGGGGDGSSGHGSDDGGGAVGGATGGAGGATSGGGQSAGQTTMDVLRGLGFRAASPGNAGRTTHSPFEEDNPEAQQRIRPMGDDLLSEIVSSQRHVRFTSPAVEVRDRTLSGASGREDSGSSPGALTPEVQDADQAEPFLPQESLLASRFLLPSTGQFASSLTNNASQAYGLDQSTFYLADLVPASAGATGGGVRQGHWPGGDGQDDDDLSDQLLFADDEPYPNDVTFSKRVSFGDLAEFSALQPSGSPLSDCTSGASERRGSRDSYASFQSRDSSHRESETGKTFLSEKSPIFLDENGVGVTHLAFKQPLGQDESVAFNPFDSTGDMGFGGGDFGSEEFLTDGEGMALLEADQKETEQGLMQEDAMQDVSGPPALSESWDPLGTMDVTRPAWMNDTGDLEPLYMRISIGTFLGSRSAALGCLDNQQPRKQTRPSFGEDNIVSPPGVRQPVALLETTQVTSSNDEVRGAGVGSDVDLEGDRTLQWEDLVKSPDADVRESRETQRDSSPEHKSTKQVQPERSKHQEFQSDYAKQNLHASEDPRSSGRSPRVEYPYERDDSPAPSESGSTSGTPTSANTSGNVTGPLSISGITNLIASTSTTARAEDLAEMIMQMSNAKPSHRKKQTTQKKVPQLSKAQEKSLEESNKDEALTKIPTRPQPRPSQGPRYSGAHRQNRHGSVEEQRRPDGKPEPSRTQRQSSTGTVKGGRVSPRFNSDRTSGTQAGRPGHGSIPENLNNSASGSGSHGLSRIPSKENLAGGSNTSSSSQSKSRVQPQRVSRGSTKIPVYGGRLSYDRDPPGPGQRTAKDKDPGKRPQGGGLSSQRDRGSLNSSGRQNSLGQDQPIHSYDQRQSDFNGRAHSREHNTSSPIPTTYRPQPEDNPKVPAEQPLHGHSERPRVVSGIDTETRESFDLREGDPQSEDRWLRHPNSNQESLRGPERPGSKERLTQDEERRPLRSNLRSDYGRRKSDRGAQDREDRQNRDTSIGIERTKVSSDKRIDRGTGKYSPESDKHGPDSGRMKESPDRGGSRQSSNRGRSRQSPDRERRLSPDRGRRLSPDRGRRLSPDRGRIQSSDRGRIQSPDRGRIQSPDRGRIQSPDRGRIQSPDRGRIQSPDRGRIQSPDRGRRLSPDRGRIQSPDRGRIQSPDRGRIQSPDRGRIQSPDRGRIQSPDRGRIQSLDRGRIQSSDRGRIQSPDRGRIQSPDRGRIQSPDRGRIQSPDRGRIQSPDRGRIQSPDRGRRLSPDRGRIQSPDRGRIQSPDSDTISGNTERGFLPLWKSPRQSSIQDPRLRSLDSTEHFDLPETEKLMCMTPFMPKPPYEALHDRENDPHYNHLVQTNKNRTDRENITDYAQMRKTNMKQLDLSSNMGSTGCSLDLRPLRELQVMPQPVLSPGVTVEAPMDLRVPEVCCVGLSTQTPLTLRNPSPVWIHVTMRVVSVSITNEPCDPDRVVPFIIKEKVIIEPNTTEEVKVIFSPRMAGVYVAQLHLMSSPVWRDLPVESPRIPAMVTLQAVAEVPNIQVLTEGDRTLDFGVLPWGRQKRMRILLVNRGRANIPVRLILASNKSTPQCFTFENHVSADTSIISLTRSPPMASLTSTVVNYTLPGFKPADRAIKPVPVPVYFRAPASQLERVGMVGLPEEHSARLIIEVDTPSSQLFIGTLDVRAAVGTARLHAPRDMQRVELLTEVGQSESHVVPLRNAGNIPLEVSLEVTHWPDFFKVTPSQVLINPNEEVEILIQFTPTQAASDRFESLLLMFVEPGGVGYEISLLGQVKVPVPRPLANTLTGHASSHALMANKHFLSWGGVALGRALQQSVTLKNNSSGVMKLRLQIRGSQTFQLQSHFGRRQHLSDEKELVLQPQEECAVHVLYAPSRVSHDSGKVLIKPAHSGSKFSIRLCGYGGLSLLVLEGLQMSQINSYWTSIQPLAPPSYSVIKTTITNTGNRVAYVKGLCFEDFGCNHAMPEAKLSVQPSEFCLQPNQSQALVILLKPSEREVALCCEQVNIIGTLAIFYGEEVSRNKYRRALVKNQGLGAITLSQTNPVRGVNFNIHYQGEDLSDEDKPVYDTPNDTELFYSTMKKMTLALIGEPPAKSSIPSTSVFTTPPTKDKMISHHFPTDLRPLKPHAHLGRTSDLHVTKDIQSSPSHIPGTFASDVTVCQQWMLQPSQVVLTTPSYEDDAVVKRVQLINFSDRPMHYMLTLPETVLVATPGQGTIPPRNMSLICLSARSMLQATGTALPWSGTVRVVCDGEFKEIQVQVHEGVTNDDSPHVSQNTFLPLSTQPGTPLVTVTTPQPQSDDYVTLTHKKLQFPTTVVSSSSEMALDVTNVSPHVVKWYISSFAPAYVKNIGAGLDSGVCRVTYPVFRLHAYSGLLQPGEQAKILVSFSPREAGNYSQFWELKTQAPQSVTTAGQTSKLELLAQGIPQAVPVAPPTLSDSTGRQSTLTQLSTKTSATEVTANKRSVRGLKAMKQVLNFHVVAPHTSNLLKFELKNLDLVEYQLEIIGPDVPFKTRSWPISIKGRHYIYIPVYFKPTKEGTFHSVMLLKSDLGTTLSIQLQGQCQIPT